MGGSVLIGHADADRFYCSAECVRNQFLVGKPLGVLGNQGACVIARSYKMSDKGVKVGDPVWEARKLCPDGIYRKRDFKWYEVLSRKMLSVLRELSPRVEYYSIDEFVFEVDPLPGRPLAATARHVPDTIWLKTGLPVTVGIGRSRTLAKLLSDEAKPFWAKAVLDPRRSGRSCDSLGHSATTPRSNGAGNGFDRK
jgi:DNA polymerase V